MLYAVAGLVLVAILASATVTVLNLTRLSSASKAADRTTADERSDNRAARGTGRGPDQADPSASPAATSPAATPPPPTASPASAPPSASPSKSASTRPPRSTQPPTTGEVVQTGSCEASFYTDEGNLTANGEVFHVASFTAANRSLPFNTRVRVTNPSNGRSVVVRINDRGPFVTGRCLDLTPAAFNTIASQSAGVADVTFEVLR